MGLTLRWQVGDHGLRQSWVGVLRHLTGNRGLSPNIRSKSTYLDIRNDLHLKFPLIEMSHIPPQDLLHPSKDGFERDPFGYAALAWHKWAIAQNLAGYFVDLTAGPTEEDLKSPVLWFSHAHAMTEAARVLLQGKPNLEPMPKGIRGACHCQYHAVVLMLVGYSLEICLKAMLIIKKGVVAYQAEEKKHHHHNLGELAGFIPGLTVKDQATLEALSHFVRWAGRYPDPGFGKLSHADEIFTLSEGHQVSARELFTLAARIMAHSREVVAKGQGVSPP